MTDDDELVGGSYKVKPATPHFRLKLGTTDLAIHPHMGSAHDGPLARGLRSKELPYPRFGRNWA